MKTGDSPYCFLFLGGTDPGRVNVDCSMQVAATRLSNWTWVVSTVVGSEKALMTWNNVLPKSAIGLKIMPFGISVSCPSFPY